MNWDKVLDFLKAIEPLVLVIIPFAYGIWLKLKLKLSSKEKEENEHQIAVNKQLFLDWRHEESIKVINRLQEICNYHSDLAHVSASYIQLENGTIATSKLSNMFLSCISEDNRYSTHTKLVDVIQRIPFIRLSSWFNNIYKSIHQVVYITNKDDIDTILYDNLGIKCMVSSLVRNPKGLVIGVCNFTFTEEHTIYELDDNDYRNQMLKFVSSIETIFLDFNINLKQKAKDLNIQGEGD